MHSLRRLLQHLLPRRAYRALTTPYHALWSFVSATRNGFPARELTVIGITGTKGKSSVAEMVTAILEEAGHKVVLSSTIHFKVAGETRPNLFKMTLPGRGFIHTLLREGRKKGCTYGVIELTSEAAVNYRHLFLSLDALVFTNLEREHLESHGSMEKYFQAKFLLGKALAHSGKRPRAIIATAESEYGKRFLQLPVERPIPFVLTDARDISYTDSGSTFTFDDTHFTLPQPGAFSIRNALAAIKTAAFLGVSVATSAQALSKLSRIPGRAEEIDAGQPFRAVVDYAHTPDSLQSLYEAYAHDASGTPRRLICVLGNTGGGRDTWKRPEMGRIAGEYCAEVILTNEDPYDEDPMHILEQMQSGMTATPRIILDRREAIRTALSRATPGDAVLITGKGTDPYIMQANGAKTPWSDARVVHEELVAREH